MTCSSGSPGSMTIKTGGTPGENIFVTLKFQLIVIAVTAQTEPIGFETASCNWMKEQGVEADRRRSRRSGVLLQKLLESSHLSERNQRADFRDNHAARANVDEHLGLHTSSNRAHLSAFSNAPS